MSGIGRVRGWDIGSIIGSWDVQPIGSRQVATWHFPSGQHIQPYTPIREATHEEWLAEQQALGHAIADDHERCIYYYEISTD